MRWIMNKLKCFFDGHVKDERTTMIINHRYYDGTKLYKVCLRCGHLEEKEVGHVYGYRDKAKWSGKL